MASTPALQVLGLKWDSLMHGTWALMGVGSRLKQHKCGPQATEGVVCPSSGWEPVVSSSSAGSPHPEIPFLSLVSQYLKIHALLVAGNKEA